jgi:hypothetical protein
MENMMSASKQFPKEFLAENEARRKRQAGLPKTAVDYKEFIKHYMAVYHAGGTRIDLCRRADITYETLTGRVGALHRKGINLPGLYLPTRVEGQLMDDLKDLVQELSQPRTPGAMKKPPVV